MANTGSPYSLRYPIASDVVNAHVDIQNLAEDTVSALNTKLGLAGGTLTGGLSGTTLSLSSTLAVTGASTLSSATINEGLVLNKTTGSLLTVQPNTDGQVALNISGAATYHMFDMRPSNTLANRLVSSASVFQLKYGSGATNALELNNSTGAFTLTGDLTISKATANLSVLGVVASGFTVSGGAGYRSDIFLKTAGATRWHIHRTATAESGSSAGSDFSIDRYTDGGSGYSALTITRSTGKTTLGSVGATAGLELGSSGPRMMSGTGSPEGSVTAPVGSIWFQTDSTVGVTHWKKASGSGNTGWVVMEGDTGSRDISADVTTNATDTLDTVQIRRVGNIVYMTLKIANSATSTTHELFATLPDGFKPVADHSTYLLPPNASSASQTTVVSVDSSNGQTQYRNNNAATMCGTVVYVTNDAWPSSLPGS